MYNFYESAVRSAMLNNDNGGKTVTTGTVIIDRFGNGHEAFSLMLKDKDKLREYLPKVDSIVTANNVLNVNTEGSFIEDSYEALLELIKMALREDLTNEQIEEFLDAEFAKKAIKVLLDLPVE